MKAVKILKTIPLKDSENGAMSFAVIENPYGEGTKPVLSVGVMLDNEKPNWKIHIPFSQIKKVQKVLKKAREKYKFYKKGKK